MTGSIRRRLAALAALSVAVGAGACASSAPAGYAQTYLAAQHNWTFRRHYASVDHLFNAFDYGHTQLYETLLRDRATAPARLEGREFPFITTRLLRHPPAVPLDEHAIGPRWATLAPDVLAMFEWAHMLHRQLYDVLSDERIAPEHRDAAVREVLHYYRSRRDLAFSDAPKSMTLMEGQPYSLHFRRAAPKYNGLLWSYHWLQMALYDALLAGDTPAARRANVEASTRRFWALLDGAPAHLPSMMPMSAAIAPRFSERYPEAAIVFDNMHALHDVVADILAAPDLSLDARRAAIATAAAAYRDSTTAVTSREEWHMMAHDMGIDAMGGAVPVRRE